MLGNLSGSEILILLLIVLLVFGANRLPDAGKAVGKGCGNSSARSLTPKKAFSGCPPPRRHEKMSSRGMPSRSG